MVKKRYIGSTNHRVSVIGLGTVKLGRHQQVKYPQPFTIPDDKAVITLLSMARTAGINLIDTAPAYGSSEERLGQLLPGQRHDWHIVSKVGEEFIDGKSQFNFTPEAIKASVERSLLRLNTDYIDTVLVHSDGNDSLLIRQGVLEVLYDLKQKGWVCLTGMSTKTVEGGLLALSHSDVIMLPYHLEDTSHTPVIAKAEYLRKGIFIKKLLASGHDCQPDRMQQVYQQGLSHPAVSSMIIGTINPLHLQQHIDLANSKY